ncbi:hypothetical protein G8A07_01425 [Roseateles sp. DAIF2]|uniref:hypothetical protein n=1 Tax=Roseateles sp. DAIF2 TaxID=2714952 RepID=UPI0018A2AC37|nr:hypothetical protein [Roseateles sp. DAIF2]QPF71720.1 hypothetical protein G8A07_01425 [Roseateles sp. DAIF2]
MTPVVLTCLTRGVVGTAVLGALVLAHATQRPDQNRRLPHAGGLAASSKPGKGATTLLVQAPLKAQTPR